MFCAAAFVAAMGALNRGPPQYSSFVYLGLDSKDPHRSVPSELPVLERRRGALGVARRFMYR